MTSHDPRNKTVLHYIDGKFVSQYEAALPLFDSGFLHGKQVWSSPRLIQGRLFRFGDHLDKIIHSAELNFFPAIPTRAEITEAVRLTLSKNQMFDGAHVRIILTAGSQITASMDLAAIIDWNDEIPPARVIVMPEYRDNVYDAENGIRLITSGFKRPGPDMVDQTSHDNNQNASSRALAEAKRAGVTSSLMYDGDGFLAEAPASHAAIVKNGVVRTPFVRCCPPGVTRKVILELCAEHQIPAEEADLTPAEVAAADELFLMGTMSGPVPVIELDGKPVGAGQTGPVTRQLTNLYQRALHSPTHTYPIFGDS
ncbi:MAG: aminotransferase class IV [Pseudomonadales bacterium]|nr:aminotransferase class IV [Pseudomonadales bacterium]